MSLGYNCRSKQQHGATQYFCFLLSSEKSNKLNSQTQTRYFWEGYILKQYFPPTCKCNQTEPRGLGRMRAGISALPITWSLSPVKDRWRGRCVPSQELGIKKQPDSLTYQVWRQALWLVKTSNASIRFLPEVKQNSASGSSCPTPISYVPQVVFK